MRVFAEAFDNNHGLEKSINGCPVYCNDYLQPICFKDQACVDKKFINKCKADKDYYKKKSTTLMNFKTILNWMYLYYFTAWVIDANEKIKDWNNVVAVCKFNLAVVFFLYFDVFKWIVQIKINKF